MSTSSNQTTQHGMNVEVDLQTKETKIRQTLQGNKFIIISTLIGTIYSLLWALLILYYTKYDTHPNNCKTFLKWTHALYICLFVSIAFNIIVLIIQITTRTNFNVSVKLLFTKNVFYYIAGIAIVICISYAYATTNKVSSCGTIAKIILGYIAIEWFITFVCLGSVVGFIIYICCCKVKEIEIKGDDISDEEIKKVI
jgi:hypothetical protein